MKNFIKLICIIVLTLSVNSCGVGYQINSYNSNNADPIYDVEVIQTQSQLDWKLRTDWDFANNYYWFLQRQNYSFFQNQYYRNRLYRFGWNSPHDYWMNWQWSWHNGYNNNGGYWNNNYWWNYQNRPYGYSHIYRPRTQWLGNVYGRNSVYGRRLQTYRNLSNTNRRLSQQRIANPNKRSMYIKNVRTIKITKERTIRTTKPVIRNKPVNRTKPVINRRPPVIRNTRPTTPRSSNRGIPRYSKKRGGQ